MALLHTNTNSAKAWMNKNLQILFKLRLNVDRGRSTGCNFTHVETFTFQHLDSHRHGLFRFVLVDAKSFSHHNLPKAALAKRFTQS